MSDGPVGQRHRRLGRQIAAAERKVRDLHAQRAREIRAAPAHVSNRELARDFGLSHQRVGQIRGPHRPVPSVPDR